MSTKKLQWTLAALIPLAASTSATAQQPQPNYQQPPPQYQQPPPSYQQPPPNYQQPPPNYQPPPPQYQQQAAPGQPPPPVQQPPPNQQRPPNYQQPPSNNAQPQSQLDAQVQNKHHDTRHGHDHIYPDRGDLVKELPHGAIAVHHAGLSYRFYEGVWFEPAGTAFIVVEPPIGLVVPTLPSFVTAVAYGGETYLYANDVYYRSRPDLGGYEVANDPIEPTLPTASTTAVSSTADQQARDRYECYLQAVSQTGFDPTRPNGGVPPAQSAERQSAYDRAQTACLQARGYPPR